MRGKIAMPVIAALLLLMAVGGNAAAAPPEDLEAYDAGAHSLALDLQVGLLDLQVAAGLTFSGVTSDGPRAMGDGTALLLAGTESGVAESNAPGGPESADACAADEELPDPIDLLGLALACVHSTATLTDGAPAATANSDSLTVPIGGAGATEAVLGPILEQALGPLSDALATLGVSVADTVSALLSTLADPAGDAVVITLAPNGSETSATAEGGVLAHAFANGATIELLPALGPLLTITVGASEASVVRDATTGEATAEANPSVVDFEFGSPTIPDIVIELIPGVPISLASLTAQIQDAVNGLINQLASASPLACGDPGPLADIVCLDASAGFILDAEEAAAEGYDFGEGTVGARTSALRLELLSLLNNGEPAVSLSLAEAVAAANAIPATPAAPTTAPPTTEEDLPRTGSGDFAPLALAAGLALTAIVLRIRRRSVTG